MAESNWDRRSFLSTTAKGLGAAALLAAGVRPAAAEPGAPAAPAPPVAPAAPAAPGRAFFQAPGRVVQVEHGGAMESMTRPKDEVVQQMVEQALMKLTGAADPQKAWAEFVVPADVVEIKINTLGKRHNSSNAATVQAILNGLKSAGVKPEAIFIYDMYGSHMRSTRDALLRPDGKQVGFSEQWGYGERVEHGAGKSRFASILERVTAVINVPVMKTHALSGITGALKNMTHGHVDNPSRFHKDGCVPGIPEIYAYPLIKDKVRVSIMDGLRLLYHGGPQDSPKHRILHNRIYAATDPVALDTILLERIQAARKEGKMKALDLPAFLAAAAKLGLGEADRAKIRLDELKLA